MNLETQLVKISFSDMPDHFVVLCPSVIQDPLLRISCKISHIALKFDIWTEKQGIWKQQKRFQLHYEH